MLTSAGAFRPMKRRRQEHLQEHRAVRHMPERRTEEGSGGQIRCPGPRGALRRSTSFGVRQRGGLGCQHETAYCSGPGKPDTARTELRALACDLHAGRRECALAGNGEFPGVPRPARVTRSADYRAWRPSTSPRRLSAAARRRNSSRRLMPHSLATCRRETPARRVRAIT